MTCSRRRPSRAIAGAGLTAGLLIATAPARDCLSAEPEVSVHALEPRSVLKRRRIELAAVGGFGINQLFTQQLTFGAELGYHFTESICVVAQGHRVLTWSNGRAAWVRDIYGQPATGAQLAYTVGASLAYVFGYGKAVVANRYIAHWEPVLSLGTGVVRTEVSLRDDAETRIRALPVYLSGAVGLRFLAGQSTAVTLAIRDHVFRDRLGPIERDAGETAAAAFDRQRKQIINIALVTVAVSVLVPRSTDRAPGR